MIHAILILAACAGGGDGGAAPVKGIEWEASWEAALARAKEENRPIAVCINMDGERANDTLAKKTYKDRSVVSVSQHTVNLFASLDVHGSGPCARAGKAITCAEHLDVEKAVRAALGLEGSQGRVIAPQHVFTGPDGSVLLSVPYAVTKGELLWCWTEAVRRVSPDDAPKQPSSARPPRRLVVGGVAADASGGGKALSHEELVELKEDMQKGRIRGGGLREKMEGILRSDDPIALELIWTLLNSRWVMRASEEIPPLLHAIGQVGHEQFWEVLVPWCAWSEVEHRLEAVVALEQLRVPDAVKGLLERWKREEHTDVRNAIIRALAATGPEEAKARRVVLAAAKSTKDKEADQRVHAVIGCADLADAKGVRGVLEPALAKGDARTRAAAAWTVAVRREAELEEVLRTALAAEVDALAREAVEAALDALAGGSGETLDDLKQRITHDTVPRDRE